MRTQFYLCVLICQLMTFRLVLAQSENPNSDFKLLEQYQGRPIVKLDVETSINLNRAELIGDLPVKVGRPLSLAELEESRKVLLARNIFEHVELSLIPAREGLELLFVLVPRLFVSTINFFGQDTLSDKQLRRLVRVRSGEKFSIPQLLKAKERLLEGYRKAGHYQVAIKLEVSQLTVPGWAEVTFEIQEGYRSRISKVSLNCDLPPDLASIPKRLEKDAIGIPVSEDNVARLRRDLVLALRREGYLQASIQQPELIYRPVPGDVEVVFSGETKDPVSINFLGNKVFSSEELLAPLKMDSRTVPFTPNSLNSLAREIEKLYQQRGYYLSTVKIDEAGQSGARQIYNLTIDERQPYRVSSVQFSGNTRIKSGILREAVKTTKAGGWILRRWQPGYLVREELESDEERIRELYAEAGYLNADIHADLVIDHDSRSIAVTFFIEEREIQEIQSVELKWEQIIAATDEEGEIPSELLTTRTEIKLGDPFSREVLRQEQRRLFQVVSALGYPNVVVELAGDAAAGEVQYNISPGRKVKVGNVTFQGNSLTHDYVLRRELDFSRGDLWSSESIEKARLGLSELGYFRQVEIVPADGTLDGPIDDLVVIVDERETGKFRVGGDFTSEDGIHLFGEIGQRNLFGRGMRVLLGVDGYIKSGDRAFDAGRARAAYAKPRVWGTETEFSTEIFYQTAVELIDQYSFDRVGSWVSFSSPFTRNIRSILGFTAFEEDLFDVAPDVILSPNDEGTSLYSLLEAAVEIDFRDNRYLPKDGFRTLLETHLSSRAFGSDVDFARFRLSHSFLEPFGSRMVWANRLSGELVHPFNSTEVVPLSQRIFLGGRNSLRGFSRNSVGPRGELGNVVGGDLSVAYTTELRYTLAESIVGLVFVDLGQAFLRNEQESDNQSLDLSDLRYSPGFGLHYDTPIGPIRAEYGIALDRQEQERFGRLNVSIGTAF